LKDINVKMSSNPWANSTHYNFKLYWIKKKIKWE